MSSCKDDEFPPEAQYEVSVTQVSETSSLTSTSVTVLHDKVVSGANAAAPGKWTKVLDKNYKKTMASSDVDAKSKFDAAVATLQRLKEEFDAEVASGDLGRGTIYIEYSVKATHQTSWDEAETVLAGPQSFIFNYEGPKIPSDAIDLATNGTANCYIVKPGTGVQFPADRMGNSTEANINGAVDAKLIWQDHKSLVEKLILADDKIYAKTGDLEGNAVVAATDESGKVLWSWHLWVTDYVPADSLYSTPAASNGSVWKMMDRNIGALSNYFEDPESRGLLFQWGRKDPFPGPAGFTAQNEDYSYITDGEMPLYDIENNAIAEKFYQTSQGNGTLALSIENPNVFYKVVPSDNAYGHDYPSMDWKKESDDDSWGGVSGKKTIYDPCPAGYKVPSMDADGNCAYDWLNYRQAAFGENPMPGAMQDDQWFPFCGSRVNYTGGLDFPEERTYGGYWIANHGKASSDLEQFPTLYGQYIYFYTNRRMYGRHMKDSRSQGLSVRCVAE